MTTTRRVPDLEGQKARPTTGTQKSPTTISNRKFRRLVRSRSTMDWSVEGVTYLKFIVEDLLTNFIDEAEKIHIDQNVDRVKKNDRETVRVGYGAVHQARINFLKRRFPHE